MATVSSVGKTDKRHPQMSKDASNPSRHLVTSNNKDLYTARVKLDASDVIVSRDDYDAPLREDEQLSLASSFSSSSARRARLSKRGASSDDYGPSGGNFTVRNAYAEKLLKIAHILHYGSIAILGVFVIQVFLKIFSMGSEFFKNKLEVFDGIVIMASFTIDLVFVEGITGAEGEEAIALIILFLLWRILRVINGIMVTAKKRQEFRIKLQKRACRRVERKLECLDDELGQKEKEIHNLKSLCLRKGASEEAIIRCRPKRSPFFAKMDTSAGLSSIASLSLGFTMSMRSSESRMRLPIAHSLVSLAGHRQPGAQDAPSLSAPVSVLRHHQSIRSRKPSSSSHSNRSSISLRPFTESRSMEKIAEERPRNCVDLGLPSSTSMQSLTAGRCSHVSGLGILPNRSGVDRVPELSEAGTSGANDICIVISDVNNAGSSADADTSLAESYRGDTLRSTSDDGALRKSSVVDSQPSSPDQSGRNVKFFVETPVNTSAENIADGRTAKTFPSDVNASPPPRDSTVNGPELSRPLSLYFVPKTYGAIGQRRVNSCSSSGASQGSKHWLPRLRKSSSSSAGRDTNTSSTVGKARHRRIWLSHFSPAKKGKNSAETFL